MALYSSLLAGSAKTWKASGGTYALTLTSLASAAARQGVKGDLADANGNLPEVCAVLITTKAASAMANGSQLSLFFGQSDSATAGTDNPGGLSGTDASLGTPAEYTLQLDRAGGLALSNNAGTGTQQQWVWFYPTNRYLSPVVYNQGDQALSGTAADSFLTLVPYYRVQQSF